MPNKVFNVEQLRLNSLLLTGNAAGELWYDGVKLANGESAVPLTRTLTFAGGISFNDGTDTKDFSANRTIQVNVDNSTIGINGVDAIYVKSGGVSWSQLHTDVAGPGLGGGHLSNLYINAGSGIQVSDDNVNIKPEGVKNSMLEGNIGNSKLDTLVLDNMVQGNAVTRDGTTITTGASSQLIVKDQGIGVDQISTAIAGNGLQGGGGNAINIVPATSSGIAVSANEIGIALGEVTNSMLAGSIANNKLLTLDTAPNGAGVGGVYGGAIEHDSTLGVVSNALGVASQGVNVTQLHANVAGNGINGGNGSQLTVDPGSGIVVNSNGVNIGETGVLTSMIKDGQVTNAKIEDGTITAAKTALVGGSGMVLNTDTFDVGATTDGGITVAADSIGVDSTVVRTTASSTQTLLGNYTFDKAVTFETGIVVKGDLTVKGETILLDSNTVNIGDNIIVLNADYNGDAAAAVDAGIEIERGTATNNAYIIFDDNTADVWKIGMAPSTASDADKANSLYQVHSTEFNRSYSVEVDSGVCFYHLPFGHTFGSVPNTTVSLQHTGEYSVTNPDLLGAMVTGVFTTGVHVAFTADTPHSGYYLNVHASTI
jgi:hypothetical protein